MKLKFKIPNKMLPDYRWHDIISWGYGLSTKYIGIDYPFLKYTKRFKFNRIYFICG